MYNDQGPQGPRGQLEYQQSVQQPPHVQQYQDSFVTNHMNAQPQLRGDINAVYSGYDQRGNPTNQNANQPSQNIHSYSSLHSIPSTFQFEKESELMRDHSGEFNNPQNRQKIIIQMWKDLPYEAKRKYYRPMPNHHPSHHPQSYHSNPHVDQQQYYGYNAQQNQPVASQRSWRSDDPNVMPITHGVLPYDTVSGNEQYYNHHSQHYQQQQQQQHHIQQQQLQQHHHQQHQHQQQQHQQHQQQQQQQHQQQQQQQQAKSKKANKQQQIEAAKEAHKKFLDAEQVIFESQPKRPMNAFFLFAKENRPRLRELYPKRPMAEITLMVSQMWKELPQEKQKEYYDTALKLKQEYAEDVSKWEQTNNRLIISKKKYKKLRSKSGKKKISEAFIFTEDGKRLSRLDKPKHPTSAFLYYLQEVRPKYTKEFPGIKAGPITQKIAEVWRDMNAESRQPYEDRAATDRERYNKEMELFKSGQFSKGRDSTGTLSQATSSTSLAAESIVTDESGHSLNDNSPSGSASVIDSEH